jgi:hypothetical protein
LVTCRTPSTPTKSLERVLTERVAPRVHLDRPAHVAHVEEGGLAVPALAGDPAHHPVGEILVLPLAQLLGVVRGEDLGDVVPPFEGVRVGIDAGLAQPLGLGAALRLGRPGGGVLRRRAGGAPRARLGIAHGSGH